jgi:hypothetical protein
MQNVPRDEIFEVEEDDEEEYDEEEVDDLNFPPGDDEEECDEEEVDDLNFPSGLGSYSLRAGFPNDSGSEELLDDDLAQIDDDGAL